VCGEELLEIKLPIGRGDRYFIIHASSKNGFVKNSLLILKNKESNAEKIQKLDQKSTLTST
jgi:hypothetical protein